MIRAHIRQGAYNYLKNYKEVVRRVEGAE
jgi:hypothetical protein